MDIFAVFSLLGGLALFLFGMDVMGKALEKQAGGRLQQLLARLTDSPLKGFFLGMLVTAVIQSSSATTVMVVGFVNSGLLSLHGAVGVILGSNVGTTVTAWILSLAGLEGDSFIIQLLKPSGFAPVLAFIGVALYMFSKREKRKGVGTILLGFAVLMTGMEAMSAAMKPLADQPWFGAMFTLFTNPVLGVLAGAALTAVIQSSSASVGILQAMTATGAVPYASAVPIIMGQNIGTCVTALLAGVGANKNARRAAMVHLYFNILGVMLFMGLFYGLSALMDLPFLGQAATPLGIAVVHTVFNVVATAVLLPAGRLLEKLALITIPDDKQPDQFQLLDQRLLSQPALAARRAGDVASAMAARARKSLVQGMALTHQWDDALAAEITSGEDEIDASEDALGTYLLLLSRQDLTLQESRDVSALLHTINDFERVGDHAVNLVDTAAEIRDKNLAFSDPARRDLEVLERAVQDILAHTMAAFTLVAGEPDGPALQAGKEAAASVEPLEQTIDELVRAVKARHVERLRRGECTIEMGFILSDLINNYERVADHCSNVAAAALSAENDSFDTHEFLERVRTGSDDFFDRVSACRARYTLDPLGGSV